jgi:hypothetical protein
MERLASANELVRLKIELRPEDGVAGLSAESVWAEPVGSENHYMIRNVPFFAHHLSLGDVVEAETRQGTLVYRRVTQRSGHSTYRLLLQGGSPSALALLLASLSEQGCRFEQAQEGWLAIDVPPSTNYLEVKEILARGEEQELWVVEEGYCGHPSSIYSSLTLQ